MKEFNLMCLRQVRVAVTGTLAFLLASCGGDGGGSSAGGPDNAKRFIYVDETGNCAGRSPCFTTLDDAAANSFYSQFDENLRPLRPDAPPDRILVMPGVYGSTYAGDWILILGIVDESGVEAPWKLELYAEEGPENTAIYGYDDGPCIWVVDNVQLTIKGFTIAGCAEVDAHLVSDDYAIFLQSYADADIRIQDNVFVDNTSPVSAIGIDPYFVNLSNLNVKILGNEFLGNSGSVWVGQFPYTVEPEYSANIAIINNVMHGNGPANPSYVAGGIYFQNSTKAEQGINIDVTHNTIVGNTTTGLQLLDSSGINVQNNIVFGNDIDIDERDSTDVVQSNLVGETSRLVSSGNFVGDPLFTDATSGDFTLTTNSPAVDAGIALQILGTEIDFFGNPRPIDGDGNGTPLSDIGAIEFYP